MTTQPAPANAVPGRAEQSLRRILLSPGYLRLLLLCVLLGVPIALACFFFVGLQHELQHWVWSALPEAAGYDAPPWWWPLPALALAGLVLAPIVTRMPGGGGHLPVNGLGGAPVGPRALPGAVLAALATLPLGVVLGPEAPLMAVGSGLALLAVRRAGAGGDPGRARSWRRRAPPPRSPPFSAARWPPPSCSSRAPASAAPSWSSCCCPVCWPARRAPWSSPASAGGPAWRSARWPCATCRRAPTRTPGTSSGASPRRRSSRCWSRWPASWAGARCPGRGSTRPSAPSPAPRRSASASPRTA